MDEPGFGTRERALLLGLMTLGGAATNPELRDHIGDAIDGAPRRRFNALGLVDSEREGRAFRNELTEEGWAWCVAELSGTAPARGGSLGRTLYAVLGLLGDYLDAADLSLGELVLTAREPAAETAETDLPALIRDAYRRVATRPQEWVLLTKVRPLLGGAPRQAVDEALRRMEQEPDVHLAPEADQKTLREQDREAAVSVGGVSKHLLSIEAR
ncbi:hypothetical protein [Actinomadura macrotermitis]|uniref:Uncharacterized protein n=1 Tax=Actinomadura macrotermitis TaxID=2585200 RepID=A0A7K0BR82_9ACTN|nr:hypothetical protein [Actinomadura macrotermitis]MQY03698.1 hypothetical protein [Actinomadura macrotermitis]